MSNISLINTQKAFLETLLLGDKKLASKLIHEQINNGLSIKQVYEEIIKIALYDVGELWEFNKISVATEHLASAIVESILNEIYPLLISSTSIEKTVFLSCVEKEYHQIGIKMVSDIFETHGWNTFFLGANTPTKDLIDFAKNIKPDVISISLSIYSHLPILERMIQEFRKAFPHLTIIVGGQAFRKGGSEMLDAYPNVEFLADLSHLENYLKKYKI